jgi:SAM-dependent methyltransferase
MFMQLIAWVALFFGFAAIIYLIYQVYSYVRCGCGKYGPFVSSYGKIKMDMIAEARAALKNAKKPMKITDLGCGSGVLLLPLAQEFPEHEFIGLEWDIVPLTMGKIKAKLAGLKNIKFVKGNYMKESHADMDVIMCYVLKVTGEPLGKKLASEIKDTAVVISEMFPLGHLEEVKQIKSSLAGVPEKIFVYKKPTAKIKTTAKTASTKKSVAKKESPKTVKKKAVKPVAKAPVRTTAKKVSTSKSQKKGA